LLDWCILEEIEKPDSGRRITTRFGRRSDDMETHIGQVNHYFNHASVAVLDLSGELKVGDTIHFVGHATDFTQQVESLEIEHQKVPSAGPNKEVALKVTQPVHKGSEVFKVS
jgi:hypothetical protein